MVFGASGSGKTFLLCKAAAAVAAAQPPGGITAVRLCGTSAASSTGKLID